MSHFLPANVLHPSFRFFSLTTLVSTHSYPQGINVNRVTFNYCVNFMTIPSCLSSHDVIIFPKLLEQGYPHCGCSKKIPPGPGYPRGKENQGVMTASGQNGKQSGLLSSNGQKVMFIQSECSSANSALTLKV